MMEEAAEAEEEKVPVVLGGEAAGALGVADNKGFG
jgi:hypothetical protein